MTILKTERPVAATNRRAAERDPNHPRTVDEAVGLAAGPSIDELRTTRASETWAPPSRPLEKGSSGRGLFDKLAEINKDVWLVVSMLLIAGMANYLIVAQKIVFGFYTLPTIFAAYCRGRRHALLTAVASALLVGFMTHLKPTLWSQTNVPGLLGTQLMDVFAWGGMLMITAYAMGTLYERQAARSRELHKTYHGLLMILRQFISNDKYTENHSYRVSVYAVTIGHQLGLGQERLELVRAAALLHDLGKLETSREVLYKAAKLTEGELKEVRQHTARGVRMLEPVAACMGSILPIILAHHDHYDGGGCQPNLAGEIPLEARIIAVADVYDALTSDRPYRKALPPSEARDTIIADSGKHFDPQVVQAFQRALEKGMLQIPEIYI